MKVKTSTFPKKAFLLATGLALGASLLAFSATNSKAEDYLFGDTGDQTSFQSKYGDGPYYAKRYYPRKHYAHRHYRSKYRYPYRVRHYRHFDPFFSPFHHRSLRSHHIRYHYPFADPYYRGYGYRGYAPYGYGFAVRLR